MRGELDVKRHEVRPREDALSRKADYANTEGKGFNIEKKEGNSLPGGGREAKDAIN